MSLQRITVNSLILLTEVLLLAGAIYFACFFRLGESSITEFDEYTAVRAVQEMDNSTQWWRPPRVGKRRYLKKPPLKMWLSLLAIRGLGESNLSFRLVDATAAAGTATVVFGFARRALPYPGAGLFSAVMLLGSYTFIHRHCARMAVYDSLLTFLCTLALVLLWRFFNTQSKLYSILGGVAIGLAVLTKSVAGLLPLLVFCPFFLTSPELRSSLKSKNYSLLYGMFAALLAATAVIAAYFVPYFLFVKRSWETSIEHEVINRFRNEWHNSDQYLIYLKALFRDSEASPPVLLAAALIFACYSVLRSQSRDRSKLCSFLLCWSLIPLAVYTALPSRLVWYLAPAIPAFSLLTGSFVAMLLTHSWARCRATSATDSLFSAGSLITVGSLAASLSTLGLTGAHYATNVQRLFAPPYTAASRSQVDTLTADLSAAVNSGLLSKIHILQLEQLSVEEYHYWQMLRHYREDLSNTDQLKNLVQAGKNPVVIAPIEQLVALQAIEQIAGYRIISHGSAKYPQQALLIVYKHHPARDELFELLKLKRSVQNFLIGKPDFATVRGFARPKLEQSRLVRVLTLPEGAFTLEGDPVMASSPTQLRFRLGSVRTPGPEGSSGSRPARGLALRCWINQRLAGEIRIERSDYASYTFPVPPGFWQPGSNLVTVSIIDTAASPTQPPLTGLRASFESVTTALLTTGQ